MPLHDVSSATPPGTEIDYAEVTAGDVTVSGTTQAGASAVVALAARIYDGITVIKLEFFCCRAETSASSTSEVIVDLWDDTTDLCRWGEIITRTAAEVHAPFHLAIRLTPTAGSHTYKAMAWRTVANGVLRAGNGTGAGRAPLFMRATKV